jgi:NitT/TauT family transport system substrate-binding protein
MIRLASFLLALLTLTSSACAEDRVVRVGFFPNVTHAQALVAHNMARQGKGWFEERLGPGVRIEWFSYNAGPSAMESILARSLDMTYVGPNPALNAHLKSEGKEIRIVCGSCIGGAALVVQPDGRIVEDADFRGKVISTPQLGNTQDVAARAWLLSRGLKITLTGGDAHVVPTANADQLSLFQKGDIDAVWTVEPWVSRLVLEAGAKIYLEERALWPDTGGRYVTTHLVSSVGFLEEQPELVRKWIEAHIELTTWIHDNPAEARRLVNDELKEITGRTLAPEILDRAWSNLELTWDPVRPSLRKSAADAHRIGFIKEAPDLSRIYELGSLNAILKSRNMPLVP